MTKPAPSLSSNSRKSRSATDLGESIAMTGGFAFAVASLLAIRDAVAAETGIATLLPFVGALGLVVVGLAMQRAQKRT